jgi:hypothetical protein
MIDILDDSVLERLQHLLISLISFVSDDGIFDGDSLGLPWLDGRGHVIYLQDQCIRVTTLQMAESTKGLCRRTSSLQRCQGNPALTTKSV